MSATPGRADPDGTRTSFAGAWLRAAVGSALALGLSLTSERARRTVVRLAREFGYHHRPGLETVLPRVQVEELLPDLPSRIRAPVAADGNVTLLELIVLNGLVRQSRPARIFEIGTFDGRTTLNLAANAPEHAMVFTLDLPSAGGPPATVDPDDVQFIRRAQHGGRSVRFRGTPEAVKIRELEGDSAAFDFSDFEGAIDFVFIDGSHAREYVLSDSNAALLMAAPGAMIVWHDYGEWRGVTSALNDLGARDPRFAGLVHVAETSLAILHTAVS
jgi:predicted O-methyltransferase YrrM